MNEMERRVKNLEEKADEKTGKRVCFAWCEVGESEEQALERWRRENPGEGDVTLYAVGWADKVTWPSNKQAPTKGAALSIEIEKLYSELEEAGFSRAEVSAMVKGEAPIPSEPVAVKPVEAMPAKEEKTLEVVKAYDLVSLFASRRR